MNNLFNKFIFFGSSDFSVLVLKELFKSGLKPELIITLPDKPTGRKQILTATPVKTLALAENIPVLEPEKLDENFLKLLDSLSCPPLDIREAVGNDKKRTDFFVVASYGKIIPKNVLALPRFGCLNIHPSLLPKYRGASPIQATLLNGDKNAGVTIMFMDEKIDHGPIITQEKIIIDKQIRFQELHNSLAKTGANILIKILPDFLAGKIKPLAQNDSEATFTKIINKTDAKINWQKSAGEIYNQWRAYEVWPGIFSELIIKNKKIKINFTAINLTEIIKKDIPAGELIVLDKKLYITAGDKYLLEIIKLQPQDRKAMSAGEFINGYLK